MIPLIDLAAELAPIRGEIDRAIARVIDGGIFVGGPEVAAFEASLAAACGVNHAIGVSSGTDALLATYMALGVEEIVTTPFTFFATAGSAARLGARVIFADIDDETLNLDPQLALAGCTPRTSAIVPVHLFGLPARLPETHIPVIEDAAQSIGTGATRFAATLSFFPTKNLGAFGDAGAILTNDRALADRLSLLRSHGAKPKYHHEILGGNFRLDALQAAILSVKLPHLARWTAQRRAHAATYRARLADLPLRLPPDDPAHVYHQFVIRTPRRDELRAHLAAAGIGTEIYYPEPLHTQPVFGGKFGEFPVAERACKEVLALPIHPALTEEAQGHVVDRIAAFYNVRDR